MKYILLTIAILLSTGCAYFSDAIGLDYNTEAEYQKAVDKRIAERDLDPAIAELIRQNLYSLWTRDRQSVLDAYELDDRVSQFIADKLAGQ